MGEDQHWSCVECYFDKVTKPNRICEKCDDGSNFISAKDQERELAGSGWTELPPDPYEKLSRVLDDAEQQASSGKGKERHATSNRYEDQVICVVQRLLKGHPYGGHAYQNGGHAYQIIKKTIEAGRLLELKGPDAAYNDLRGCKMSIKELEQKVIAWAYARKLYYKSTEYTRFIKFAEEVEEFTDELFPDGWPKKDMEKVKMEAGDVLVTLINLLHPLGLDLKTCLDAAYTKINKRTGKMVNGQYVRDK